MINQPDHDKHLAYIQAVANDLTFLPRAAEITRLTGLDSALDLIQARHASAEEEFNRLQSPQWGEEEDYNFRDLSGQRRDLLGRLESMVKHEVSRTSRAWEISGIALEDFCVIHGRVSDSNTLQPPPEGLIIQAVAGGGTVMGGMYLDVHGYFQLRMSSFDGGVTVTLRLLDEAGNILQTYGEQHSLVYGKLIYRDLVHRAGEKAVKTLSVEALTVNAEIDSDPQRKEKVLADLKKTPGRRLRGGGKVPLPTKPAKTQDPSQKPPEKEPIKEPSGKDEQDKPPEKKPPAKKPPAKSPPKKRPPKKRPPKKRPPKKKPPAKEPSGGQASGKGGG